MIQGTTLRDQKIPRQGRLNVTAPAELLMHMLQECIEDGAIDKYDSRDEEVEIDEELPG